MPSLRICTIRVTGPDGVLWEGTGESLPWAVCGLVRRRAGRLPAADPHIHAAPVDPDGPRWRLTPKAEAFVAARPGSVACAGAAAVPTAPAAPAGAVPR